MAGEQEAEPSRPFLAASYLVLAVGGGLLGLYEALLLPYSVSSGVSARTPSGGGAAGHVIAAGSGGGLAQLLSVGLLVAVIANPALAFVGLWTVGTRLAAFTPLIGWLAVVLVLAQSRSTGSIILPSTNRTVGFLLIGLLSFVAVGAFGRPSPGATGKIAGPPPAPTKSAPRKSAGGRTAPRGSRRR